MPSWYQAITVALTIAAAFKAVEILYTYSHLWRAFRAKEEDYETPEPPVFVWAHKLATRHPRAKPLELGVGLAWRSPFLGLACAAWVFCSPGGSAKLLLILACVAAGQAAGSQFYFFFTMMLERAGYLYRPLSRAGLTFRRGYSPQEERIKNPEEKTLDPIVSLALVSFALVSTFGSIYYALQRTAPKSFASSSHLQLGPGLWLYTSIVTAGTVGFGDVTPVSGIAQLTVSLEIILAVATVPLYISYLFTGHQDRQVIAISKLRNAAERRGPSVVEELEKLRSWAENGTITADEFESAKAAVIRAAER